MKDQSVGVQHGTEAPPSEALTCLHDGYDAFDRGDWDKVLSYLDEEIVWEQPPLTPESGVFRGHAEVRGWFDRFAEIFVDMSIEAFDIRAVGDWLIARVRLTGHAAASGLEVGMRFVQAWRWDGERFDYVKERTSMKKAIAELSEGDADAK